MAPGGTIWDARNDEEQRKWQIRGQVWTVTAENPKNNDA